MCQPTKNRHKSLTIPLQNPIQNTLGQSIPTVSLDMSSLGQLMRGLGRLMRSLSPLMRSLDHLMRSQGQEYTKRRSMLPPKATSMITEEVNLKVICSEAISRTQTIATVEALQESPQKDILITTEENLKSQRVQNRDM